MASGRRPAAEVEEFPADTTMGQIQEAGELDDRGQVRRPAVRAQQPADRVRSRASTSTSASTSPSELGVEPSFREATSDNRIPLLVDGTIDLILSTMTITEERDLEIDFSEPYYVANGDVLVPEGSDIQSLDDLNGKSVCTALGSTYADTIEKEVPEAELRLVDLYSECLDLIQTGAVDAVSTDNVILTGMVIQDDTLQLLGLDYTTEPYGIGIPEGDTEMKEFVDDVGRPSTSTAAPGRRPTTSGSASTSRRTSSRVRRTSPSRRRSRCSRSRSSGRQPSPRVRRGA